MHASDEPVIPADVAVVLICPCAPFAMCSELAWRLVACANVCAEHDAVCAVGAYVGCSAHEPRLELVSGVPQISPKSVN